MGDGEGGGVESHLHEMLGEFETAVVLLPELRMLELEGVVRVHVRGSRSAPDDRSPALAVGALADRIDAGVVAVDQCEFRDRNLVQFPVDMAHFYYAAMCTRVSLYFIIDLVVFGRVE